METNNNQGGEIDMKAAAKAFSQLGASKGGKARAEKLTPEQRREIALRASEARWAKARETQPLPSDKLPQEICSGVLSIGGIDLPCAVVENPADPAHPIRLFSQEGFLQALGRAGKAKGGHGASVVDSPPPFLAASNLKDYIPKHLTWSTHPIIFKPKGGSRAFGFRAELLPEVCWIYLDARNAGEFKRQTGQRRIAEHCEILLRGLATVGIVALVDEATGYQERRAKDELRFVIDEIIKSYVLPERTKYDSKFDESFFKEVYRLHGWEFKPGNAKRTPLLGKIINKYIYGVFPKCVPDEIRNRNPIRANGRRKDKNYYWLTEEPGIKLLEQQIYTVTKFMESAETKEDFERAFERAFAKEFQQRLSLTYEEDLKESGGKQPK